MLRKLAIVCGAIGAMAISGGAQAQTGFQICNKTSYDLDVAKALNTGEKNPQGGNIIISEGWYKFAKGECAVMWSGKLRFRYYLVYAQYKPEAKEWKGSIPICVASQAFKIESDVCPPDKNRRMFIQVDTGETSESWTFNFTDR